MAKGAGTFGTVTVGDGGRFSPGNSPGTAIVSGLTFGSGGRYDFELNGANATPGNGADFLNVLGNLHIAAGTTPNSVFTLAITSLNGSNQQAALGDFDPRQSYTLTLATAAGGITGFSANEFVVDTGAFGNSLQGGNFTVLLSGNSLQLQFTPVPEPAALSALVVGVAVVGCVRRRVRRSRLTTST